MTPFPSLASLRRLAALGVLAAISAACASGLSAERAKAAVQDSALIRQTDTVSVDAVSATNDTEAIARTTINGRTINLKFRRYDKGWTWEFVETKGGGWIAPDLAIAQMREEERTAAAAKWAEQHKDAYSKTASVVNIMSIYVPNPRQGIYADVWLQQRRQFAGFFKNGRDPERFAILSNDHPLDAWGEEIQGRFDASKNIALVFSSGPDKKGGTEDDLACMSTFRPGFEDGRQVWHRDVTWVLPEGLGSLVQPYADDLLDKIEFTKVIKP